MKQEGTAVASTYCYDFFFCQLQPTVGANIKTSIASAMFGAVLFGGRSYSSNPCRTCVAFDSVELSLVLRAVSGDDEGLLWRQG